MPNELDGFGARVKARRLELGLTMEALGKRIAVHRQAIIQYEQGRCVPRLNHALALADALEIPLYRLTESGRVFDSEEATVSDRLLREAWNRYDTLADKLDALAQEARR